MLRAGTVKMARISKTIAAKHEALIEELRAAELEARTKHVGMFLHGDPGDSDEDREGGPSGGAKTKAWGPKH